MLAVMTVIGSARPASAGGSWLYPVSDRYEAGDVVTLVGYSGGGAYGWVDDAPFFGTVMATGEDGFTPERDGPSFEVGEMVVAETGQPGWTVMRAAIEFELPADLPAGTYFFDYCNTDCREKFGDLIGGYFHVGIDPPYPIGREWPADDPEWTNVVRVDLDEEAGEAEEADETEEADEGLDDGTEESAVASSSTSQTTPTSPAPSTSAAPTSTASPTSAAETEAATAASSTSSESLAVRAGDGAEVESVAAPPEVATSPLVVGRDSAGGGIGAGAIGAIGVAAAGALLAAFVLARRRSPLLKSE